MTFNLPIKLFVDCAHPGTIALQAEKMHISGFTTNPTLMRREGVTNYEAWAKSVIVAAAGKPVSFEVLADTQEEMLRQAKVIAGWGGNVYVKIPITNTKGEPTEMVVRNLSRWGIGINITAIMTVEQVEMALNWLNPKRHAILSIFAGRIADTLCDPIDTVAPSVMLVRQKSDIRFGIGPYIQVLWASTREVFNIADAIRAHADIITVTPEILAKLPMQTMNLNELSRATVQQFYDDAVAAGYRL